MEILQILGVEEKKMYLNIKCSTISKPDFSLALIRLIKSKIRYN